MDCKEFRHMVLGDPSTAEDETHLEACADCRAYVDRVHALDATIEKALTVDVPELKMPELPPIDTADVVTLAERRRVTTPVWLAMAATVTMAAVITVYSLTSNVEYPDLASEIVAHMDHEPYAMRVSSTPVSDERLSSVIPADVANVSRDAGLITYAQSCNINGKSVPHLVIQGEQGPVTILLLPDEKVSKAQPLEGESINGVLLPVGDGSIAIIGEDNGEDLELIQKRVLDSVSWQT